MRPPAMWKISPGWPEEIEGTNALEDSDPAQRRNTDADGVTLQASTGSVTRRNWFNGNKGGLRNRRLWSLHRASEWQTGELLSCPLGRTRRRRHRNHRGFEDWFALAS